MAILTVGTGKQFNTIQTAVDAAKSGDTINVDAGTYTNQYAVITKNLTLNGVGGRVELNSTGLIPNGKGIFVTTGDVTVNNFDFAGAKVADLNGAGIRHQGGNLTLNNDGFFNDEMGVLTDNLGTDKITVNNSEFGNNGHNSTNGQGHSLYVGRSDSLTVNGSYFHGVQYGHEIKSRANTNLVENSRVYDLNSTASYTIDLPEGGNATIKNDVIQQGPNSPNYTIISYGEEGNINPGTNFTVSDNKIINDVTGHGTGVRNATGVTAHITNNEIYGLTSSQIAAGPNTQSGNTLLATRPTLDESSPRSGGTTTPPPITTPPATTGGGTTTTPPTTSGGTTTPPPTSKPPADGGGTITPPSTNPPPQTLSELSVKLASDTGTSATDHITSSATVKGEGTPKLPVTIKEGSKTLGTTTADNAGLWTFTPKLVDGSHTITASQTSNGKTETGSVSFTLDKTQPTESIRLFLDTGVSATDHITSFPVLTGTGQPNTAVTLKEGDTNLGTTMSDVNGNWTFLPSLASGQHTITATDTDLAGNTGSASLHFTLDTNFLFGLDSHV